MAETTDLAGTVVPDCADEPIRVPGSVQPHGVLLACDADRRVVVASTSAAEHLGVTAQEALGLPLEDLLGTTATPSPDDEPGDARTLEISPPSGRRQRADVTVHEQDGLLVVEVEPHLSDGPQPTQARVRPVLRALQRSANEAELTRVLATQVRALTGFDRVMVYRFDRDWNGEVVAEALREGLEPYLGLHYPASDIPAQARALYTSQWIRSIPDARYEPSPLVPPVHPGTGQPLDLSGSVLRSVSPVHLQYLANMGVRASMSVSLVVHGELWGLVACHHESGPRHLTAAERGSAEFVARTASLVLQGMVDAARHVDDLAVAAVAAEITRELAAHPRDPVVALTADDRLLDLVDATGAVVRLDAQVVRLGEAPDDDVLARVAERLAAHDAFVSDAVGRDLPGVDPATLARSSGLLAVRLTAGADGDMIVWSRPEVLREVRWAGDPHEKELAVTPEGPRLHPRRSFAAWVEQVRGTSPPWTAPEVAAARRLAQDVDALLARRRAEQERLTTALRRVVLTERVPTPPGYAVVPRFVPSGSQALGGDWYDVTQLADGRVVLTVGDVAGHGMGVAGITAQVRNALRALLLDEGSAVAAIRRLSGLVAALVPGELATVVAVELDPPSGRARVSRAGHLPVLRVTADGAAFVTGAEGPALGLDLGGFTEAELTLAPGDALVLYTDGVVEERGTALAASLEQLRERAAAVGPDATALADALVPAEGTTADDVTLVAVRRT